MKRFKKLLQKFLEVCSECLCCGGYRGHLFLVGLSPNSNYSKSLNNNNKDVLTFGNKSVSPSENNQQIKSIIPINSPSKLLCNQF